MPGPLSLSPVKNQRDRFGTQKPSTDLGKCTYLQRGDRYGYVRRPPGLVLQEPGHLVGATVEERVPGHRVPALGGQGFSQGQIVVRSVRPATSDLKTKRPDVDVQQRQK